MKRSLGLLTAVFATLFFAGQSLAGPSRAIIQEMGLVTGAEEVNVDVDWVAQNLNVTAPGDTTVGAGNATIGGITLSSVNIGLTENLELRIGRLPGLRSFVALPVGSSANYGLTLKAAGFVPGLGLWLGYGLSDLSDITSGNSAGDTEGSSFRLGGAYTWAGPVVLNGSLGYGLDASSTAGTDGPDTTTIEVAGAILYPVRPTLLVGVELHYASIEADYATGTDYELSVLVPALGARVIAGNWTIDAIVALLGSSVGVDTTPSSTLDDASATVIGVPTVRVNYKF